MESDSCIKSNNVEKRKDIDPLPGIGNILQSIWIRCRTFDGNQINKWLLERYTPLLLLSGFFWYILLLLS